MVSKFDPIIADVIKEELVLTKLSNTFEVRRFNEEYFVLIRGVIVPYRIFMLGILKYGLWTIRFSKSDWFLINRDLMALWTELNIVPTGAVFDPEKKDFKNAPIRWFKEALICFDFDKEIKEFFAVRCGDDLDYKAKYEALLYLAEQEYEALAK